MDASHPVAGSLLHPGAAFQSRKLRRVPTLPTASVRSVLRAAFLAIREREVRLARLRHLDVARQSCHGYHVLQAVLGIGFSFVGNGRAQAQLQRLRTTRERQLWKHLPRAPFEALQPRLHRQTRISAIGKVHVSQPRPRFVAGRSNVQLPRQRTRGFRLRLHVPTGRILLPEPTGCDHACAPGQHLVADDEDVRACQRTRPSGVTRTIHPHKPSGRRKRDECKEMDWKPYVTIKNLNYYREGDPFKAASTRGTLHWEMISTWAWNSAGEGPKLSVLVGVLQKVHECIHVFERRHVA